MKQNAFPRVKQGIKNTLYQSLVTRVPGIQGRFLCARHGHARHGHARRRGRVRALAGLLWNNARYYLLRERHLAQPCAYPVYEQIPLPSGSESRRRVPVHVLAEQLSAYDLISFDVFDTLLLRPFARPEDLFDLLGAALDYPHFKRLRMEAERLVRARHGEPTLAQIWHELSRQTGLSAERGMALEFEYEQRCCQSNPYFLALLHELHQRGKRVAVLSDMYLSSDHIRSLLRDYPSFDFYLVSCEHGCSKHDGGLYRLLRQRLQVSGSSPRCIHIGDNAFADVQQAQAQGLAALHYPSTAARGDAFRPHDLSPLTGSLYRGLVNNHLHNGLAAFSQPYEYGYVYGGLLLTGYCQFIHEQARLTKADALLFLARDGYILCRAYRQLYPQEAANTFYVPWSRRASLKICADHFRSEYLTRFITHKAGQGFSIRQVLTDMDLPQLPLPPRLHARTRLTHKNAAILQQYMIDHWPRVVSAYREQRLAAGLYYRKLLKNKKHALAIDIGWAGSSVQTLRYAATHLWKLSCRITGLVAATASGLTPDGDPTPPFLGSHSLRSFAFSSLHNRDLWKFHDPLRRHNLYLELLFSAPEGSLTGFYQGAHGSYRLAYQAAPPHPEALHEIHRGLLDFARSWQTLEQRLGRPLPISGRDAYAPLIALFSHENRAYLHALEDLLDDVHV